MGFQFRRKESVSKAIRRLASNRTAHALRSLRRLEDPEAIHAVRQDIKKLRALLRLVRGAILARHYRRTWRALRCAAGHLAGQRDAFVRLRAFDKLVGHSGRKPQPAGLRQFRAGLEKACQEETRIFIERNLGKEVRKIFLRLARQLEGLPLELKGWAAIAPGLEMAYRAGRSCYKTVLEQPSADGFHRWRKQVKLLWYQIGLLGKIWPEQLGALAAELKQLGEDLGEDHDLVLLSSAKGLHSKRGSNAVRDVLGALELRQSELRSTALNRGAHLYAERSRVFCGRLHGYWRRWRAGKRPKRARLPAIAAKAA